MLIAHKVHQAHKPQPGDTAPTVKLLGQAPASCVVHAGLETKRPRASQLAWCATEGQGQHGLLAALKGACRLCKTACCCVPDMPQDLGLAPMQGVRQQSTGHIDCDTWQPPLRPATPQPARCTTLQGGVQHHCCRTITHCCCFCCLHGPRSFREHAAKGGMQRAPTSKPPHNVSSTQPYKTYAPDAGYAAKASSCLGAFARHRPAMDMNMCSAHHHEHNAMHMNVRVLAITTTPTKHTQPVQHSDYETPNPSKHSDYETHTQLHALGLSPAWGGRHCCHCRRSSRRMGHSGCRTPLRLSTALLLTRVGA